jgi:hypothetical protein
VDGKLGREHAYPMTRLRQDCVKVINPSLFATAQTLLWTEKENDVIVPDYRIVGVWCRLLGPQGDLGMFVNRFDGVIKVPYGTSGV